MKTERTHKVICLTPVRDEAWILPFFLRAASLWADRIILVDQGSCDGSLQIAYQFPKVTVLSNPAGCYDEAYRQRKLLAEARGLHGPRILVPLDADEFLSPGLTKPEWFDRLASSGPGAYSLVPFFNVRQGMADGWDGHEHFVAGWVDDGSEHFPDVIHSRRVPFGRGPRVEAMAGERVMHWQFVAPARMRSKHRWYVAWERLNRPQRSPVEVFRQYNHMLGVPSECMLPLPPAWLQEYRARGVDFEEIRDDGRHRWDRELLAWMDEYGARHFSREAIWAHDWSAEASAAGLPQPQRFRDPRSVWQRLVHRWLAFSQPHYPSRAMLLLDRFLTRIF